MNFKRFGFLLAGVVVSVATVFGQDQRDEIYVDSVLFNMSKDAQNSLRDVFADPSEVSWEIYTISNIMFDSKDITGSDTLRRNEVLRYPLVSEQSEKRDKFNPDNVKYRTRMNLFTLILKLAMKKMSDVPCYAVPKTKSGVDIPDFVEENRLKSPKEIWNKFTTDKFSEDNLSMIEVLGFRIKKRYYFESESSEVHSEIINIAPITRDTSGTGYAYPFYVSYKSVMPWLMMYNLSVSETNNADEINFDTFFRKELYTEDITKIQNPLNKSLSEIYNNDKDAIKKRQDEFKQSLKNFSKAIWVNTNAKIQEKMLLQNAKTEKKPKSKKKSEPVVEKKVEEPKVTN